MNFGKNRRIKPIWTIVQLICMESKQRLAIMATHRELNVDVIWRAWANAHTNIDINKS